MGPGVPALPPGTRRAPFRGPLARRPGQNDPTFGTRPAAWLLFSSGRPPPEAVGQGSRKQAFRLSADRPPPSGNTCTGGGTAKTDQPRRSTVLRDIRLVRALEEGTFS